MSGYIGLNRTGFAPFDSALSMIEEAGDAYHHTSQWIDEGWNGEKPYLDQINDEISLAADAYMTLLEELQTGRLQWMVRETSAEEKVATLTRQRDLAVEWLERCAVHVRPTATIFYEEIMEALSAIKESEKT